MRQLCKNFLINWTICANRWANSRNAQRAACHMAPVAPPFSSSLPNCQLPVASGQLLLLGGDSRATLRWHINSHVMPDNCTRQGRSKGTKEGKVEGELTRRQPTYLCRAGVESSCNYETETQTQPPGSSSSSTCCLDWWPRSLVCCWGSCCCCCCCCWLWLYTSCGQTTQYINSPALAYFILRKKIMANIRELCDAAHQRESARHDR